MFEYMEVGRNMIENLKKSIDMQSITSSRTTFSMKRAAVRVPRSTSVRVNAIFGAKESAPASLYDITVKDISGKDFAMTKLKGKVVLFVNLASRCGFTPQYADLAALYDQFGKKGFEIVGQPCNQFGAQEPGSDAEVQKFASSKGAKFPILSKADVNGPNSSPLWAFLRSKTGGLLGDSVKWNFEKVLVGKDGQVIGRYPPTTNPKDLASIIEKNL